MNDLAGIVLNMELKASTSVFIGGAKAFIRDFAAFVKGADALADLGSATTGLVNEAFAVKTLVQNGDWNRLTNSTEKILVETEKFAPDLELFQRNFTQTTEEAVKVANRTNAQSWSKATMLYINDLDRVIQKLVKEYDILAERKDNDDMLVMRVVDAIFADLEKFVSDFPDAIAPMPNDETSIAMRVKLREDIRHASELSAWPAPTATRERIYYSKWYNDIVSVAVEFLSDQFIIATSVRLTQDDFIDWFDTEVENGMEANDPGDSLLDMITETKVKLVRFGEMKKLAYDNLNEAIEHNLMENANFPFLAMRDYLVDLNNVMTYAGQNPRGLQKYHPFLAFGPITNVGEKTGIQGEVFDYYDYKKAILRQDQAISTITEITSDYIELFTYNLVMKGAFAAGDIIKTVLPRVSSSKAF